MDKGDYMKCNQCVAAMINGVFCHETGCPNTNSRYDVDSDEWIKQSKCFTCGCMVDADDACCDEELESEECTVCGGCGEICTTCDESPDNCECSDDGSTWEECKPCAGTGWIG